MSAYILEGKRTALGSFLGGLSGVEATELGAKAISGAMKASNIAGDQIEQVFMGQVLQAGSGQAPARQAALKANISNSASCVTVNKVCGSGLEAIISASKSILLNEAKLCVAGGMESMSNAPHLSWLRNGTKMGDIKMKDSMVSDGLWDSFTNQHMGSCTEICIQKYNFSRSELDQFAISSFEKAIEAQKQNIFAKEITPISIASRKGELVIEEDEGPSNFRPKKIPELRPVFQKDGKVTAANASSLNDGAAALVIGGEEFKSQAHFKILGWASHAQDSLWFSTAPVMAMKKNLEKCGLKISDIDLFEINEAFAAVSLAAIKDLEINPSKVNVFGGAISLGHPLGCSGARIVVTLMNALKQKNKKIGMASLCIGGGEALSIIIENLN